MFGTARARAAGSVCRSFAGSYPVQTINYPNTRQLHASSKSNYRWIAQAQAEAEAEAQAKAQGKNPSDRSGKEFNANPRPNPISVLDTTPKTQAEQRRSDWQIIKKLMRYVWPRDDRGIKYRVALAVVLLLAGKLLNVQVPFYFKNIVDALAVLDTPLEPNWTTLGTVAGFSLAGFGLVRLGASAFSELRNAIFAKVAQRAIRTVARQTLVHLLHMDLAFHLERQTGGLTRAIDRGTKGISFLLSSIVFHVFPTAFEIVMVCAILSYKFGYSYALMTLGTMSAYTWFTVQTTAWRNHFRKQANDADNKGATVAVDSLLNYEAVKHFNNEQHEIQAYDATLADYEKASLKVATSLAYLNVGQNLIFTSALTAMMVMASKSVLGGTMSIGDLVMINQLVFQLSLPLNFLGTVYRELRQSLVDMEALFKLQDMKKSVTTPPDAPPLVLKNGEIRFNNITFGYVKDRDIFREFSLHLPAGQRIGIVGPSGCGKSTLFRLLFRFYDPVSGHISIDDQDISKVDTASLHHLIGVVPQDTPLLHNDIMHNIRYGRLDATDEEVYEAARKAQVHHTIQSLPQAYQTTVGERGLMISGGEKQRLAIARVLLKDPPIIFFDEATSALDTRTEADLLKTLQNSLSSGQRTIISIAHRLKTISNSDLIIVLNQGQVAEQGTHDHLMNMQGLYYQMWQSQAQEVTDEPTVPETES